MLSDYQEEQKKEVIEILSSARNLCENKLQANYCSFEENTINLVSANLSLLIKHVIDGKVWS